jgi:hypothetical protein
MPRILKKYNPQNPETKEESIPPKANEMSQEQEGEGAILNLAVKALSHLIPGLLSKFGEKAGEHVGDAVGKAVKDKIEQMRGKGVKFQDVEPERKFVLNRRVKGKNVGPISSYEVDPEIIPVAKKRGRPPKKQQGEGINVAGMPSMHSMPCKPCKKGGANKLAGGANKLAGGRKQKGSGVVEMKGKGILVENRIVDMPKNLDKLHSMMCDNNQFPKNSKGQIIKTYNNALMRIMDVLGTGETITSQLNDIGIVLFGKKFGGAVASDMLPSKINGKYYIVNTDDSDESGTHWMAVTDKYIYDSFGRTATQLSEFINDRKLLNKNKNRDQSFNEFNCGQRSLAFLITHSIHGDKISEFI